MTIPRYKAGPVDFWLAEACTEFLNGCIDGLGSGTIVGGGTGAVTLSSSAINHEHIDGGKQMLFSGLAFVAAIIGSGVRRFTLWHHNGNPFPNPWPKPAVPPAL